MIKGLHAMCFSTAADAPRAFLRDKLELDARDAGEGWLTSAGLASSPAPA